MQNKFGYSLFNKREGGGREKERNRDRERERRWGEEKRLGRERCQIAPAERGSGWGLSLKGLDRPVSIALDSLSMDSIDSAYKVFRDKMHLL